MSITAADFFSQITTPTIVGTQLVRRIPFTFTSTARLLKSGKINVLGQDYNQAAAQAQLDQQLLAIEQETRPVLTTLTSTASALGAISPVSSVLPVIQMAINPNSIHWTQAKRYTKRDTQNGSVFFHFTNDNDQNNDILVCQFSGQTGNINTNVNIADAAFLGSNLKLKIWHELYNLSREGLLLNQSNCGRNFGHAIRNEIFITYKTALMTVPITMIGFFNQVLEFTETAADPFNRNYSFSFTVTSTSPNLDELSNKLTTALTVNNFAPNV